MIELQQGDYSIIDIDYRIAKPIQGDFKSLSVEEENKLLKSYQEMSIFRPALTIWVDESEDEPVYNLIDGHQSQSLFIKHKIKIDGGYIVKALKIAADTLEDAKRKLLIINSEYGEKDVNGFFNFTKDMNLNWIKEHASFKIERMDMNSMMFDFEQRIIQSDKARNNFLKFKPNTGEKQKPVISGLENKNNAVGNSEKDDHNNSNENSSSESSGQSSEQKQEVAKIITKKAQKETQIGKATEDEFTMFQRVMRVEDYKEWIELLNYVRTNFLKAPNNDLSHAMVYIMNYFKTNLEIE